MNLDNLMELAEAVVDPHETTWANVYAKDAFADAFTPEVAKALIRVAKAAKHQSLGKGTELGDALAELEALP